MYNLDYIREMFVGKRLFPDEKFEKDTGIIGKTEIVSAGGQCVDYQYYNTRTKKGYDTLSYDRNVFTQCKYDDGSLVENFFQKTKVCWSLTKFCYVYKTKIITKEEATKLALKAKSRLKNYEQLIFCEEYTGLDLPDYAPFEYCGFDLIHDYEGGSALYDIGYQFNGDSDVTEKLNKYGLFDTKEDIIYYKKKVSDDDTEHNCGEYVDFGRIFAVWRYVK